MHAENWEANVKVGNQLPVPLVRLLHERHQHVVWSLLWSALIIHGIQLDVILRICPETLWHAINTHALVLKHPTSKRFLCITSLLCYWTHLCNSCSRQQWFQRPIGRRGIWRSSGTQRTHRGNQGTNSRYPYQNSCYRNLPLTSLRWRIMDILN